MSVEHWRENRLEDLVEVLDHLRVPVNSDARAKRQGDVPYYGANGQQGWIDQPLFDERLILLAEDGGNFDEFRTRPIAYRIEGPAWVNNHAHIIRAFDGVNQDFIFWAVVNKDIRRYIAGGTRSKLTQAELRAIELVTPPLPEQRRIAEILDTLDEAIRKTEQVIAKLQQMKQGLLHDLLTRGIDEHGELRDPGRHPEQFKDSPLGRIPRGWDAVPLPALCRYQNGAPFPSSEYGSNGVALLRPGNLQIEDFVVWDDRHTTYLPLKWEVAARDFIVGPGEVVMNLTAQSLDDGFLGRMCVTPPGTRCLLNQRIARFRVHGCDPMYFFWACRSPAVRPQIDRLCQGTKVQHIYNRNLDSLLIPVPSRPTEQTTIETMLFGHGGRVRKEQAHLDKLRTLKQGLMDDLLTGRVRVPVPDQAAP